LTVLKTANECGWALPPESRIAMATTSIIKAGSSGDRPGTESSETNWKWFPHKEREREREE